MSNFFSIIFILISLIFGYLCGSIPFGVILGKLIFKKDPRDYGSCNSGATNVGRTFGKRYGFLTIVLDSSKSILSIWIILLITRLVNKEYSLFMDPTYYAYITAFSSAIGHTFPIFAKFKGGKAVSCFFGILGSINFGLLNAVGLIYFIVLKSSKMVSLSSIIASSLAFLLVFIPFFKYLQLWGMYYDPWLSLLLFLLGVLVNIRHIGNMKRIKNGTERKITWLK